MTAVALGPKNLSRTHIQGSQTADNCVKIYLNEFANGMPSGTGRTMNYVNQEMPRNASDKM